MLNVESNLKLRPTHDADLISAIQYIFAPSISNDYETHAVKVNV